jgi:hypothetical protein
MSVTDLVEVEVWVMVDEEGQSVVCGDKDKLQERWEEEVGDFDPGTAKRLIRATIRVPMPCVVELEAEIAAEPGAAELKVA